MSVKNIPSCSALDYLDFVYAFPCVGSHTLLGYSIIGRTRVLHAIVLRALLLICMLLMRNESELLALRVMLSMCLF